MMAVTMGQITIRAEGGVMTTIIEKIRWAEKIHQMIVMDISVKIIRVVIIHAHDIQVHHEGIEEIITVVEEIKATMIGNILLNPTNQASIPANKVHSTSHLLEIDIEMEVTMGARVTQAAQGVHHR